MSVEELEDRLAAPFEHGSVQGPAVDMVPIVVDLDGTLVETDTLIEMLVRLVKRSPSVVFQVAFWLFLGRARFKSEVARRVALSAILLPYNPKLLAYLREQRAGGRRIVLATAAHISIASGVAEHLGLFDEVIASDDQNNLKGQAKLSAIQARYGGRFIYAGDSPVDLPIWIGAVGAILVGVSQSLARRVALQVPIVLAVPKRQAGPAVWLRALRVHQWIKNVLIFVPLLTSFGFARISELGPALLAFVAFSLTASATYILNDLWDLDSDRAHARKRLRPFASGALSIPQGLAVMLLTLGSGLLLSAAISMAVMAMVIFYVLLSTSYSLMFKKYVLIDVMILALLYTYRIFVGSVAIGVTTSAWLLEFSVFLFLSLALVKRCSELFMLQSTEEQEVRGRNYMVSDLAVLLPFGVGAALSAVVVFGLFINAPETQVKYGTPHVLWFVAIGLVYWTGRLWIKTSRGEMHDDPIVFAARDRGSLIVLAGMIVATLAAYYLPFGTI